MDNSGLFAEIFKDYKKPPKDVVGKLSDAYASYQDFIAPKNELERNIQGMIEVESCWCGHGCWSSGSQRTLQECSADC